MEKLASDQLCAKSNATSTPQPTPQPPNILAPPQFQAPFNPEVFKKEEEKMKRKKLAHLQNLAAALNYQLTPLP